jgi:hypothetical protein
MNEHELPPDPDLDVLLPEIAEHSGLLSGLAGERRVRLPNLA